MKEEILVYLIIAFGFISLIVYLYLWLVKKSVKPLSDNVIGALGICYMIFFVVFLMNRCQEVGDIELTFTDYLKVSIFAMIFPCFVMGLVSINLLIRYFSGDRTILEEVVDHESNEEE